jgi:hypothetical protein
MQVTTFNKYLTHIIHWRFWVTCKAHARRYAMMSIFDPFISRASSPWAKCFGTRSFSAFSSGGDGGAGCAFFSALAEGAKGGGVPAELLIDVMLMGGIQD